MIGIGIASTILIALAAACSGGAPTPTVAPTLTPTQPPTPTLAPTPKPASAPTFAPAPATTRATGLLVREPESFEGYTLYSGEGVYLIDHAGQFVSRWEPDRDVMLAKLLDNGNLLLSRNIEIDPDRGAVWEHPRLQHHGLLKMPNENVLSRDGFHFTRGGHRPRREPGQRFLPLRKGASRLSKFARRARRTARLSGNGRRLFTSFRISTRRNPTMEQSPTTPNA